jgi:hypothetical protein
MEHLKEEIDPGVALIRATNVLWEVTNEEDFAR